MKAFMIRNVCYTFKLLYMLFVIIKRRFRIHLLAHPLLPLPPFPPPPLFPCLVQGSPVTFRRIGLLDVLVAPGYIMP